MPLSSMIYKRTPKENIISLLTTSMQGVGFVKDHTTALKIAEAAKPKEYKSSKIKKYKSFWAPKLSAEASILEQSHWSSTTQQPEMAKSTVPVRTFTEWAELEGTQMRVLR